MALLRESLAVGRPVALLGVAAASVVILPFAEVVVMYFFGRERYKPCCSELETHMGRARQCGGLSVEER